MYEMFFIYKYNSSPENNSLFGSVQYYLRKTYSLLCSRASKVHYQVSSGHWIKDMNKVLFCFQDAYYAALTRESGISRVPPVLFRIRLRDSEAKRNNLYTYRDYKYIVLDNETFIRRLEK